MKCPMDTEGRETDLMRAAPAALRLVLHRSGWDIVQVTREVRLGREYTADLMVELRSGQQHAALVVEVKTHPRPSTVRGTALLVSRLLRESHGADVAMAFFAPRITRPLASLLRDIGWGYFDLTGAAYLRWPGLFIHQPPEDLCRVEELFTLNDHAARVLAVAVTPDGRRAVSGCDDGMLKAWDLRSGQVVLSLRAHESLLMAVAVTPDSRQAVSGSHDQTLRAWNLETGEERRTLQGHAARVNAVALTPDGRQAVSGSDDHTLRVWNLRTGRARLTLRGHGDSVRAVAVTPDGRQVVSASDDCMLMVWGLRHGEAVLSLQGHQAAVNGVAVTPDGARAISASSDRTLKVWDLPSGECMLTLEGHGSAVRGVAVTPDGRWAVSASADNTLKVWALGSGESALRLEGHDRGVRGVAVTPDGRQAVSASDDGTLRVWDLRLADDGLVVAHSLGAGLAGKDVPRTAAPLLGTGGTKRHRVLRVLLSYLDRRWHQSELAAEAGVSPFPAHTVAQSLLGEQYADYEGAGPHKVVYVVRPADLLDAWAAAWADVWKRAIRSAVPCFSLASVDQTREDLADAAGRIGAKVGFTLSAGANAYGSYLRDDQIHAYVLGPVDELARAAKLEPVRRGANVILMPARDEGLLYLPADVRKRWGISESAIAAPVCPVQLYLDMRAAGGRYAEQAEALRREVLGY